MLLAGLDRGTIATHAVAVPSSAVLFVRSIILSVTATLGAILLGLLPAAVLGSCRRRVLPVLMGLALATLLIPPQVYAYVWGLILSPNGWLGRWLPAVDSPMWVGGAVRAGAISACWLWPIVAMILAVGWRTTGRTVYSLAILDTTPIRAFIRAVVPSLRPHLVASAALVFAVTLLEYAIPHLTLSRVYATELQVLVDIGAPNGQIMAIAAQVIGVILLLIALAAWSVRKIADWQPADTDYDSRPVSLGYGPWWGSLLIWSISVALPVLVMATSLRSWVAWQEGFILFAREWGVSLGVSLMAGGLAVTLAVGTVVLWRATDRKWLRAGTRIGALTALGAALMPPAALGIGFVVVFNRPGFAGNLYTYTVWVWVLSLATRYGAVAILVAWLALGRRAMITVDQARTDGAGSLDIIKYVLLPWVWPSLLAAAIIVVLLSLFEVVLTQMVGPLGFPSIAMTLLGHMHYGRDDVVITTSLTVVAAGIMVSQVCSWLLMRARK
jgi:ABC-type Fe3+ transport system permease subunit